ncbi:transposase [Sporolactobacillus shoreicorticis]|uniref:Transposase n=1 Tax=Sporolactobacillus shoreicorticis TaxID=1923877 RepID=A0ABW5S3C1_9BACL
MQYLKRTDVHSSRLLQDKFPELKKRCLGQHLWSRDYFYATVGTVTDEIIRTYFANQSNKIKDNIFKIND